MRRLEEGARQRVTGRINATLMEGTTRVSVKDERESESLPLTSQGDMPATAGGG